MNAIPCLPFPNLQSGDPSQGPVQKSKDWFIALRHARLPLRQEDRLVLLYGHPLLFRLGLYSVAERVLTGEPVIYLDGTNTFDPFFVGRLARAQRQQPRKVLTMIHVARAYSPRQMDRLVSECLSGALDRYEAGMAVLSGLFETFYDKAVPEQEALRLFGRMMESILKLKQQGATLLCLCPSPAILTQTGRRCFDQLRSQADRAFHVAEEQGMVRIEEEGRDQNRSWQVPRSVLLTGSEKTR